MSKTIMQVKTGSCIRAFILWCPKRRIMMKFSRNWQITDLIRHVAITEITLSRNVER